SRFIVDIQAVPAVREYSHLPVVVDPSHATFKRKYVSPVARAAIAAGADGILVDVHPTPDKAAVDPLQALSYCAFENLMRELRGIAQVLGRAL
ncbi:MAG: 3-deoxy-7-phosphoheptulonate synthase, partial [Candidatus Binatia bacterium]